MNRLSLESFVSCRHLTSTSKTWLFFLQAKILEIMNRLLELCTSWFLSSSSFSWKFSKRSQTSWNTIDWWLSKLIQPLCWCCTQTRQFFEMRGQAIPFKSCTELVISFLEVLQKPLLKQTPKWVSSESNQNLKHELHLSRLPQLSFTEFALCHTTKHTLTCRLHRYLQLSSLGSPKEK